MLDVEIPLPLAIAILIVLMVVSLFMLSACEREERRLSSPASSSGLAGKTGLGVDTASLVDAEQNAYSVSQGQQLFVALNCAGCHSNGGGGMGRPLRDAEWRYGWRPEDIRASILDGRPNGMPSFRGKITDEQTAQLVAYVRSMSGLTRYDVTPGRTESLAPGPAPNMIDHRLSSTPRPEGTEAPR